MLTDHQYKDIIELSNNFTIIIHKLDLFKIKYWNNGIGDRFCNKKFNYTVIYSNKKIKTYSNNENDTVSIDNINNFFNNNKYKNIKINGIIGIFIHSKRYVNDNHPININIKNKLKNKSCVSCGSNTNIIIDHKNDLYNDLRVLNIYTQNINDFQPLCNHCNLQKRTILIKEKQNNKIYSAKNIQKYSFIDFEIPFEKYNYDINDINFKSDSYWYDPINFNYLLYKYIKYILPILLELKTVLKKYFKN
jgi:hypothetical protein